ncbi:hypothetical protein D3C76_1475820 [compost metagenome]
MSRLQADGLTAPMASRACCSRSMVATSASCSALLSHLASCGLESSQKNTKKHSATEAMPSMNSIHCQPCRPRPWICINAPASGPEINEASAEPLRKMAMALPRSAAGSQRVK